jgi:hypothetical protein
MRKFFTFVGMGLLIAGGAALAARGQVNTGGSGPCDRACLEGFIDRYLDAVIAHDPKRVPMTANAKFTENGQRLNVGDGFWRSVVSKGNYRLFVTDVEAGQVTFIGTITEEGRTPAPGGAPPRGGGPGAPAGGRGFAQAQGPGRGAPGGPGAGAPAPGPGAAPRGGGGGNTNGGPSAIAIRLKIVNRQITEMENFIVRNEGAANNIEAAGKPHSLFTETVPAAERMSRADLVRYSNMYFTGMQKNDGKGVPDPDDAHRVPYPFADDCDRFENGNKTTSNGQPKPDPKTANSYSTAWSCMEQFQSGLIHFVTRIRDRRFVAIDPERGLTFSFVFFDHSAGDTRRFQAPDGRTVTNGPTRPFTWQIAELFKVEKNKIRRIEAILQESPYGMNSGWSSWEDGLSDKGRDVSKQ